jgi:hypothetical protein
MGHRDLPADQGLGGSCEGPGNSARAVRTLRGRRRPPAATAGAARRRWRPLAGPGRPRAALRASTAASSWSHWPSRRSSSRRSPSTCAARTVTDRPSRSWAASSLAAATSDASPSSPSGATGGRWAGPWVECVFESMGATYQPHPPTQAPTPRMWTTIWRSGMNTSASRTLPIGARGAPVAAGRSGGQRVLRPWAAWRLTGSAWWLWDASLRSSPLTGVLQMLRRPANEERKSVDPEYRTRRAPAPYRRPHDPRTTAPGTCMGPS